MITTLETTAGLPSVHGVLHADFASASQQLTHARRRQREKDTPGHRAAVLEARDRIDAVLDMYLDLRQPDIRHPG